MIGNMNFNEKNSVVYLTFPELERFNFIKHAFSTRFGGVSKNEFSSMNLGFNRGDLRKNVIENYRRLCTSIGVNIYDLVASSQDHGTFIRCVGEKEKGIGIFKNHDIKSVDGLLTNVPNVALVTYYADCTPLYFLDRVKKVIGLAHAGWRGTVARIGEKMIDKMKNNYGCNPSDVVCAIGPTIGKCCFEVGEEVASKCLEIGPYAKKAGGEKFYVDLQSVNKEVLVQAGVPEENIIKADICTKCYADLLFSHRQTNGKRGTMVAVLELI